jgi:hypothetical protein
VTLWRPHGGGSRGATIGDVDGAACRLLRALNENQAHDRVGAEVEPGEQEASDAGLRPDSPLYRAAVWWLLDMEALVPDREANARARNAAGAQHHNFRFKITRGGLDMLRRA